MQSFSTEKNLTQDEFIRFYSRYIHYQDKVSLAAWIIRLLPEEIIKDMVQDMAQE